jgi:hypothetical protein
MHNQPRTRHCTPVSRGQLRGRSGQQGTVCMRCRQRAKMCRWDISLPAASATSKRWDTRTPRCNCCTMSHQRRCKCQRDMNQSTPPKEVPSRLQTSRQGMEYRRHRQQSCIAPVHTLRLRGLVPRPHADTHNRRRMRHTRQLRRHCICPRHTEHRSRRWSLRYRTRSLAPLRSCCTLWRPRVRTSQADRWRQGDFAPATLRRTRIQRRSRSTAGCRQGRTFRASMSCRRRRSNSHHSRCQAVQCTRCKYQSQRCCTCQGHTRPTKGFGTWSPPRTRSRRCSPYTRSCHLWSTSLPGTASPTATLHRQSTRCQVQACSRDTPSHPQRCTSLRHRCRLAASRSRTPHCIRSRRYSRRTAPCRQSCTCQADTASQRRWSTRRHTRSRRRRCSRCTTSHPLRRIGRQGMLPTTAPTSQSLRGTRSRRCTENTARCRRVSTCRRGTSTPSSSLSRCRTQSQLVAHTPCTSTRRRQRTYPPDIGLPASCQLQRQSHMHSRRRKAGSLTCRRCCTGLQRRRYPPPTWSQGHRMIRAVRRSRCILNEQHKHAVSGARALRMTAGTLTVGTSGAVLTHAALVSRRAGGAGRTCIAGGACAGAQRRRLGGRAAKATTCARAGWSRGRSPDASRCEAVTRCGSTRHPQRDIQWSLTVTET